MRKSINAAVTTFVSLCLAFLCIGAYGAFESSKCLLVLQVGSDWCESGDYVRKVFESKEFRDAFGGAFEFAVFDDMDFPTPEVKAANEKLKDLYVPSRRFPAITCVSATPRRFFAQLENIPYDITAGKLISQIFETIKVKEQVESFFEKGKTTTDAAKSLDAYGQGFNLLCAQVGEFNEEKLRKGPLSYKEQWDAIVKADKDDKYGWKRRFEMGYGVDLVKKATDFRIKKDFEGGKKYIQTLRAIPTNPLTVVQRQCFDIAEYALWRTDESRLESNKAILRNALALGRDTVWGQCALGYLIIHGEKFEKRPRTSAAKVLPRPQAAKKNPPKFKLNAIEKRLSYSKSSKSYTEAEKLAIARYAVLRRIGKDGWDELHMRPGSEKFIKEFFNDRVWMEDFVWSGVCSDWKSAILALESIVFQDGGRWYKGEDGAARRFMTALALVHPKKDEAFLADFLDAYRTTALAKRLHKLSLSQPVWQWRIAINHTAGPSHPAGTERGFNYAGELADQQRFFDNYVNVSLNGYGGTCWIVPWRQDNCFGETVHGPLYYQSWRAADEWILRSYTPIIGGVCGELSKFGSACGNAHGLPSCPVGQPAHCALTRRLPNGDWVINYSISPATGFSANLFSYRDGGSYQYIEAHEGTFEGERETRLNADRILEMVNLATDEGAAADKVYELYAKACKAWPTHYVAWRDASEWICRKARPIKEHREFIDSCVGSLQYWRNPLWEILTQYFKRVAKEQGNDELAQEIIRIMPRLKQGGKKVQEDGFIDAYVERWTKPLNASDKLKERVLLAALEVQIGTKDYFSQMLTTTAKFMMNDNERMSRFTKAILSFTEKGGENKPAIDFGKLILSASQSENIMAFRQFADVQEKLNPSKVNGKPYPESDFGGVLVSADGLLKTSSLHRWQSPTTYPKALNAAFFTGNAFHTNRENAPWATVVLAGPCTIRGVLIENKTSVGCRPRQVPIEVQISENGNDWVTVYTDSTVRDTYRVELGDKAARAKYVRVRRTPDSKNEFFHLSKILVYGNKLY